MRRLALLLCAATALSACADAVGGGVPAQTATPTPTPTPTATPTPSPSPSVTPTPPPKEQSLRFLAIGDFGTGWPQQYDVADRMCRLRRRRPFKLVVTTGDNIYDYGHPDRFGPAFFQPYDCLFDAGVRFRSTLGNHDIGTDNGRPELQEPAFGFKGRNYVVRRNGVRFVMVDSNDLRWDWLRRALIAEQGDRWTVVVFHHPVFSSGEHGSTPGFRPGLPRMFRRRGVDLVLNGHDHNYEATRELRGIRYVVTGGGGASIRACGPLIAQSQTCVARYHFLEVTAGPDEIVVRAIPPNGGAFHTFRTDGRD